ncbi:hypothetical protein G6L37_04530 [Agrobacterium rubi]|nr:hypothetical protein [Agrobacterium rubi]NTF24619.1 hypothetical protein [Agrobacterium rubi]
MLEARFILVLVPAATAHDFDIVVCDSPSFLQRVALSLPSGQIVAVKQV